MGIPWNIVGSAFTDGCLGLIRMFESDIRVPGSPSADLIRVTTPETLERYRTVDSNLPDQLLKMRDEALAHDRHYARAVRFAGLIELAAIFALVCFLTQRLSF